MKGSLSMKKRLGVLIFAMAAMILFAACGGNGGTEPPAQPSLRDRDESRDETNRRDRPEREDTQAESPEYYAQAQSPQYDNLDVSPGQREGFPTRGVWRDGVYTSEYLGLRFVLLSGWTASTDEQIAAITDMIPGMMGELGSDLPPAAWEMAGITTFHEMMAGGFSANIQIVFERLMPPMTNITAAQYAEIAVAQMTALGIGTVMDPGQGITRIGAYDWISLGTAIDMGPFTAYGRQFINVHDGFVRIIIITYTENSETVDEILSMFIGLNDPVPHVPQLEMELDSTLLGTWAWDTDAGYTYVFNTDGTGRRGFPGLIEQFEWMTEGADHLMIHTAIMVESWSYTISGNVLTIDSRQVPGMTFSYMRQ